MKFVFLSIGKDHDKGLREMISEYTKRVSRHIPAEWKLIPSSDVSRETKAMLKFIEYGDFVVVLDERGKELATKELAMLIEKRMIASDRRIVFVVGGAYGLDETIIERADFHWSLSKLTFPHQVARLILAESVYRALSVIKKEPYHHE